MHKKSENKNIKGSVCLHGALFAVGLAAATATVVVAIVTTVVTAAGKYKDQDDDPPAAVTAEKAIVIAHKIRFLPSVLEHKLYPK
ncbi:MAG: hypothetical protein IJA62_06440 [Ruminococcus sp.]|nr:hypothetical protein [Ruminococcus sp.]